MKSVRLSENGKSMFVINQCNFNVLLSLVR